MRHGQCSQLSPQIFSPLSGSVILATQATHQYFFTHTHVVYCSGLLKNDTNRYMYYQKVSIIFFKSHSNKLHRQVWFWIQCAHDRTFNDPYRKPLRKNVRGQADNLRAVDSIVGKGAGYILKTHGLKTKGGIKAAHTSYDYSLIHERLWISQYTYKLEKWKLD